MIHMGGSHEYVRDVQYIRDFSVSKRCLICLRGSLREEGACRFNEWKTRRGVC